MPYNKIWKLKPPSPNAESLAREIGIDSLLAQLLYNRNLKDKESTLAFLAPKLTSLLDPSGFKEMQQAIDLVLISLEKEELYET